MHTRYGWLALVVLSLACGTLRDDKGASQKVSGETLPAGHTAAPSAGPNTLLDDYGDRIVFGAPAQRVVSLNPTTTELLFAMGAGDRLVGRSSWDVWPDSAKLVPALGNAIRPNVEAILAVHPDLVILYASADNRRATEQLHAFGVKTLSLKVDRIADFARATRIIGQLVGDSTRAETVVDTVMRTLDRVRTATRTATRTVPRPTVVWPLSYRPVIVVGGGSFLNELLEIAGATNLYAGLATPSPEVTIEDVVQKNPQYVLKSADTTQTGAMSQLWSAVPAVRLGHVLVTSTSVVARPSVQLGEAAVQIARVLHPELHLQ